MALAALVTLQFSGYAYASGVEAEFGDIMQVDLSDMPRSYAVVRNYSRSGREITPYAYRDTLVIAFKEMRAHDYSEIQRYDYQYQTFQYLNGYTSTTTYTFIKEYVISGRLYQANVKYSFY